MAICLDMLLSSIGITFLNVLNASMTSLLPWPDILSLDAHNSALNLHPSLCLLQK